MQPERPTVREPRNDNAANRAVTICQHRSMPDVRANTDGRVCSRGVPALRKASHQGETSQNVASSKARHTQMNQLISKPSKWYLNCRPFPKMAFDSTLGYPGEGPGVPLQDAAIIMTSGTSASSAEPLTCRYKRQRANGQRCRGCNVVVAKVNKNTARRCEVCNLCVCKEECARANPFCLGRRIELPISHATA